MRIGIVGTENSHADHYVRHFNTDEDYPGHRVVALAGGRNERNVKLAEAGGIFADAGAGLGAVPEDQLGRIEIPTTIVDCRLSPPFLRKSCGRLRELMPQARAVTLEQSGHHVGIDAHEELLALLREAVATRGETSQIGR